MATEHAEGGHGPMAQFEIKSLIPIKIGDVVLVEFFDYACGFCRASNPDVERLLREDDVRKTNSKDGGKK